MENTRKGIVYHIFCVVNGKCYIGQTWTTLETRWKQHCESPAHCRKLRGAINKYGKERFVLSVLTSGLSNQNDMDAAERYWISYFDSVKNGYNIMDGGRTGCTFSDECIKRMSEVQMGHEVTQETRDKISKGMTGRKRSDASKKKQSQTLMGRKIPDNVKEKMSRSHKRRPFVDQDGIVYETLGKASKELGSSRGGIWNALNGKSPTVKGKTLRYLDFTEQEKDNV